MKKLDEKTFNLIKALTEAGWTYDKIAEYTGVSKATIQRVRAANDMDDYKRRMNEYQQNYRAKTTAVTVTTVPAPVPPVDTATKYYVNNRLFELMKEQNEMLKLISAKLAFIVDQLV